ncbi:DMT family transporter [candidate division KSB1 bacterium]|nr:DMT family transporter [candidate division KSB1 bacterium]
MPYLGELSALSAAFLWGGTVILFEEVGKRVGALVTNTGRILIGLMLLCLTLWIQKGVFFPVFADSNQVLWLGLSGIVGLAIGDGALFSALVILGSRRSTLLLSLAPPITTILAWMFLHEHLRWIALTGILLTVFGIFWVVLESNPAEPVRGSKIKGIGLGILAALGQAVGMIFVKYGFRSDIDALSATILRMAPAAVLLVLITLRQGKIGVLGQMFRRRKLSLALVVGSIIGPFLGVWLSIVAVKHTQAGIASTLLSTVPIMVIPPMILIYGIRPSPRALIGTAVAMLGIALIFLR